MLIYIEVMLTMKFDCFIGDFVLAAIISEG